MLGLYTVAYGDDYVEVVYLNDAGLSFPFDRAMRGGVCIFCTYHFFIQFSFLKYVSDMPGNNRPVSLEKQGHLFFCEPDSLVIKFNIDTGPAVGSLVEDNLSFGGSDQLILICLCCQIVVNLKCGKIECHNGVRHRFEWELPYRFYGIR